MKLKVSAGRTGRNAIRSVRQDHQVLERGSGRALSTKGIRGRIHEVQGPSPHTPSTIRCSTARDGSPGPSRKNGKTKSGIPSGPGGGGLRARSLGGAIAPFLRFERPSPAPSPLAATLELCPQPLGLSPEAKGSYLDSEGSESDRAQELDGDAGRRRTTMRPRRIALLLRRAAPRVARRAATSGARGQCSEESAGTHRTLVDRRP